MTGFDLQLELLLCARALRPQDRTPVSIVKIATDLGVRVVLSLHVADSNPPAQINLRTHPPKIKLYRRAKVEGERHIEPGEESLLSARERFSVAHELGHWIAFHRFQILPHSDGRAYWEQEQAINDFAGCLLVPDWLVARWLHGIPDGRPIPPFALKRWASSECCSSEEVVAKAIARGRASIGFLKLLPAKRSKDGKEVLQVLSAASGAALHLPKERSHIDDPNLDRHLKRAKVGSAWLPQLRLGRCEPQDLLVAWRRGTLVKSQETIWLSLASRKRDSESDKLIQLEPHQNLNI